jgi:DNA topoisomerase-1
VDEVSADGTIRATLQNGKKVSALPHQIEQSDGVARLDTPATTIPEAKPERVKKPLPPLVVPEGMHVATPEDRKRLKVPPAWENVVVADDPTSPLQARGLDAGRKAQYRYTAEYEQEQADIKFARIRELHRKLPQLDAALQRDAPTNDTALAVYLMRKMGVRNGGSVTNATTKAYGTTTLEARHVVVDPDGTMRLDFIGKEGIHQNHVVTDPLLKQLLAERIEGKGPTDKLFKTDSNKTLEYLKKEADGDYKIHDLRTYLANALTLKAMSGIDRPQELKEFKRMQMEIAMFVSQVLGNKPQQSLKSYINPAAWNTWVQDHPDWGLNVRDTGNVI